MSDLFRLLFANSLAGTAIHELIYDAGGQPCDYRFLDVNPAFEELTGLRHAAIVGRTVREAIPDIEDLWIRRYGEVVRSGQAAHFEEYAQALGRWFEVMAFPLGGDRFAVSCTDVTGRKQAEIERLRSADVLRQALRDAEAASVAKTQFLSVMSHEIRTPLNGVIGMADLLMQSGLTAEQEAMAEIIQDCGEALLAIVGDVLDLARIEAGSIAIEAHALDIRRLVEGVHGMFAATAKAKGIELAVRVGREVPRHVRGDSVRLRQVLINLVGNAVKFTERGSVELRVDTASALDGQVTVVWEVVDTGPGIAPDYLPRLFEPFSQADAGPSRRHGGTGLGLAIAKRLTGLMGGELTVESELGRGSRFRCMVPLVRSTGGDDGLDEEGGPPGPPSWRRRPEVLVVEDDPTCQFTMAMMLDALGCSHSLAEDGEKAVAAVAARAPDIVLMDCQMPVCDGYAAARAIRQAENGGARRLPIVAVTANVLTEDRERCRAAGMDGFLAKPLSLAALRASLVEHLHSLLG